MIYLKQRCEYRRLVLLIPKNVPISRSSSAGHIAVSDTCLPHCCHVIDKRDVDNMSNLLCCEIMHAQATYLLTLLNAQYVKDDVQPERTTIIARGRSKRQTLLDVGI